ncbi:tubulin-folding cofactor B-like isoform X2 [Pollicipes pollicipes]|nr:tubulin-folding cofactor B-like isoform X2 [Pollicipes pollicipes]
MAEYQVVTADTVNVMVTSNITQFPMQKRFQKSLTILALKNKLELVTGGSAATMRLSLYDKQDQFVCAMDSETALLGSFPVDEGMRLHVEDKTCKKGEFEDTSNIQKYELSDEQYNSKQDTLRAYLERTKQGKYDQAEMARLAAEKERKQREEEARAATITVGARCEVARPGQLATRGTVRFCGPTDFSTGIWVGIQCDEPVGKNDGSVNGRRYFECADKYGLMTRPASVTVGDFPERAIDADDDDDEM